MKTRLTLVALALLTLAGCGRKAAPAGAAASGPQIWKVGNGAEPEGLDPHTITGVTEHKLTMALFEGLLSEDPKDLSPRPGLAETWKIEDEGKTYVFNIRANAKWSDGSPITAGDLVQSYKRILTPTLAAEYAYLIFDYVVGAKEYYEGKLTDFSQVGFKAPDDRTLVVSLKNPAPYLLKIIATHYSWTPVPVKVIQKFGALDSKTNPWTKPGNLVGSGPFMLKEWSPDQKIVVVRNPHYWDAATVKLDQIEFYPITDSAAEERMFRTGQLHMTNTLPTAKIDVYRKEYPDALRIEPYLGIYYYRFNVTKPPLNDKRVRRALALAIDRESLVKNVTRGEQVPAYGATPPDIAGYTARTRLQGTIQEAKRLLAEAGYPEGRGLPPIELLYNTSEAHMEIASALQAMWKTNLGVDIRLINQEWKVYLDMQDTLNYTMSRAGWIADYVDPHVFLEIWVTGNGNNDTGWSNAEFDRLYASALVAKSESERYEIYQKMDAIIVDELPILPIYFYTRVHAVSPKVKGYHPTVLDSHPYKYIWLEN